MKKLTQKQIEKDIDLHNKWLSEKKGGVRIDWSWSNLDGLDLSLADLSWANIRNSSLKMANLSRVRLCGADLTGSNIENAKMNWSDLSGAIGLVYADCSWPDNGENGNRLFAVRINGVDLYYCGSFYGIYLDAKKNILRGANIYIKQRMIALEFVASRMAEMTESKS